MPPADDNEPPRPGEDPAPRAPDDSLAAMVNGASRTAEGIQVNGHPHVPDASPPDFSRDGWLRDSRFFDRGSGEPSGEMPHPAAGPQETSEPDDPDEQPGFDTVLTREQVLGERLAPSEPSHGLGRRLRSIAGVDESILDWVPEERARYTRLGAIIMNTGLLAGLSLITALNHVVRAPLAAMLFVGLFWAFMVMSFDGWLIASTHGVIGAMKIWYFLPRIVISILLGAVIAEPLVLWAFAPAVDQNVQEYRASTLAAAVTDWTRCNPPSGNQPSGAACTGYILDIPGGDSPAIAHQHLRGLQNQRTVITSRIASNNAQLERMEKLARDECNGDKGTGFSGFVGQGPNCDRDRAEADQFRQDSGLNQDQAALTNLDAQIVTANNQLQTITDNYGNNVAKAIAQAKASKQAEQDGTTGLLEQSAALGRLSAHSGFVLAAQWMLRLLLIALDCLPALAKLIGGTTSYDRLVNARLQLRKRMHARNVESTEHRYAHQQRVVDEILNDEVRAGRARQRAAQRTEIENLVEEFRARRRVVGE
jgi:Domain of unknown function (DUF4407)